MISSGPKEITLNGVAYETPMFFPSISTVKTSLSPFEYLAILRQSHKLHKLNKNLLISAFDLAQSSSNSTSELITNLQQAHNEGMVILLDSGIYEAFWKDQKDSWEQKNFHDILHKCPCAFSFGFDKFDEHDPPLKMTDHVNLMVSRWNSDRKIGGGRTIIPIVHGDLRSGRYTNLPKICFQVAQKTKIPMIAVAERELGEGIIQRINTVKSLRKALNRIDRGIGLHLLGTGDPISIALYSWAGATSFDGLEWCRNVVDHHTACLFHLSHTDFFKESLLDKHKTPATFQGQALRQNLQFYRDWMKLLREHIHDNDKFVAFCKHTFTQNVFEKCADEFQWRT